MTRPSHAPTFRESAHHVLSVKIGPDIARGADKESEASKAGGSRAS